MSNEPVYQTPISIQKMTRFPVENLEAVHNAAHRLYVTPISINSGEHMSPTAWRNVMWAIWTLTRRKQTVSEDYVLKALTILAATPTTPKEG